MVPIAAVLFDLDNTLHDRDRAFRSWVAWFVRERLGIAAGPERDDAARFIVDLDAERHGSKDALFRRIAECYPALTEEADALVESFRIDMLTHLGPPDPGTLHLLDALDAGRIPWGVVTNGSAAQLDRVRALGLAERPTCVVVSEVVGLRKPDPAIFLLGAERLGAGLGRTLFVGDNPKADIVGARRTGMRTAWLRHGRDWPASLYPVAPDLTLDALGDLLPLLGLDAAQGP